MKYSNLILILVLITSFKVFAFDSEVKLAIDQDNVEKLSLQKIEKLNAENKDRTGKTPLLYAIQYSKFKTAQYLIERGLGINAKDFLGRSPLIVSFSKKDQIELIQLLIENGADVSVKDKNGRDILYYARVSQNLKVIGRAEQLLNNFNINEIQAQNELKNILEAGNQENLKNFMRKFGTINVKIENLSLLDYLIKSQNITKWDLRNLLNEGMNSFGQNFGHKLLREKLFESFKQIQSYKPNIEKDENGETLLEVGIKNNAPEEIIKSIIERQVDFSFKDSRGNNYLHLAIQFKRLELLPLLKAKKISMEELNAEGETPLMMLIRNGNTEVIEQEVSDRTNNLNAIGSNGNDAIIILAKKDPELFTRLMPIIKLNGYDFRHTNVIGESAMSSVPDSSLSSEEEAENSVNRIPELERAPIEVGVLDTFSQELSQSENDLSDPASYLGDRLFDDWVNKEVDNKIRDLRTNYYNRLLSLQGGEDRELQDVQKLYESTLERLNQNKIKIESFESKKQSSIQEHAHLNELVRSYGNRSDAVIVSSKLQTALDNVKEFVNQANQDFKELSEGKKELEAVLQQLKFGMDSFKEEILKINKSIYDLELEKKSFIEQYRKYQDEDLVGLNSEKEGLENRLEHERKSWDDLDSQISRDQSNLSQHQSQVSYWQSRENHPNHNPETCEFTKKKKEEIQIVSNLSRSIKLQEDARTKVKADFLHFQDLLSEVGNSISKIKNRNEKDFLKYENKLKQDFKIRKDHLVLELDSVKKARDLEFTDVVNRNKVLEDAITREYGEIEKVETAWNEVFDFTNNINKMADLKRNIVCAFGVGSICQPKIDLGKLGDSKFAIRFLELTSELSTSYQAYDNVLSNVSGLETLLVQLKESEQVVADIQTSLEEVFQGNRVIESELAELDSKQQELLRNDSRGAIGKILELEEKAFRQKFFNGIEDFELSARLALKKSLGVDEQFDFESLIEKTPEESANLILDDITELEKAKVSISYNKEQSVSLLKQWHNVITEKYQGIVTGAIFHPFGQKLFVHSLKDKIKFTLVTDGVHQTTKIMTSVGEFMLGLDGMPIEVERVSNAPYEFELVSTGIVRSRVEELQGQLRVKYPDFEALELNQKHDLSIISSLLKLADHINDVKLSGEILDYIQLGLVVAAPFSGGIGSLASSFFGLAKCSLEAYKYYKLGLYRSSFGKIDAIYACIENIFLFGTFKLFPSQFKYIEELFKNNSIAGRLTNVVKEVLFNPKMSSSKTEKYFFELLQGFFNFGLNDVDEEVFIKDGNKFKKIFEIIRILSKTETTSFGNTEIFGIVIKSLSIKLGDNITIQTYKMNNQYRVLNACNYAESKVKSVLRDVLKGISISLVDEHLVDYKKEESILLIGGSPCLYLQK